MIAFFLFFPCAQPRSACKKRHSLPSLTFVAGLLPGSSLPQMKFWRTFASLQFARSFSVLCLASIPVSKGETTYLQELRTRLIAVVHQGVRVLTYNYNAPWLLRSQAAWLTFLTTLWGNYWENVPLETGLTCFNWKDDFYDFSQHGSKLVGPSILRFVYPMQNT